MKYDCELIQDMLALYMEDVLSETSIQIIEEHLSQCDKCRNLYQGMKKNHVENIEEKIHTEKFVKFSKKIRKIRATIISLMVVAVISIVSIPLLCFSANNFNTVNFISSGVGVMQVICTSTQYVEIQSSPRVIIAKPDNVKATFISIIESEGYTFISDDSQSISQENNEYSIDNIQMLDEPIATKGTFIISKNGKREYISWSLNDYYSKFIWT